jgi:hypothetical protein
MKLGRFSKNRFPCWQGFLAIEEKGRVSLLRIEGAYFRGVTLENGERDIFALLTNAQS